MDGRMLYAGIDEAGYGPLLGPLCVAMAVFDAPASDTSDHIVPDLWELLSQSICRKAADTTTSRIAVNDSKILKGANSLKTKHPLTHLERGVLGFLLSKGEECSCPENDSGLLEMLGAVTTGSNDALPEWQLGEGIALPVSTTPDHLRLIGGRLRAQCARASVRLMDFTVRSLHERAFNAELADAPSKADVTLNIVGSLIGRVWRSRRSIIHRDEPPAVVVVDRQSGRMHYAAMLRVAANGATIAVLSENSEGSMYELTEPIGDGRQRCIRVMFRVGAERAHLPVALASMCAKYIRELMMMRFNRYWSGRYSELKPTAGYFTDARRWLEDLKHLSGLPDTALRELCRRA